MLINFTNHPSSEWSAEQLNAAEKEYDKIYDMPFPPIPPEASSQEVLELAKIFSQRCCELLKDSDNKKSAVHISGEFNFTYSVVTLLKKQGIKCVASTSKRNTVNEGVKKVIIFEFVKFREYL